jgi:endo-1,4-beta-D-glucanase Y
MSRSASLLASAFALSLVSGCKTDNPNVPPSGNGDMEGTPTHGDGSMGHDGAAANDLAGGGGQDSGGGPQDFAVGPPDMIPLPSSYTFGSHPMKYPSDVLMPSGSQASLDQTTEQAYDTWKANYVKQGCGGYYVLTGGGSGMNVGDTVSEGHGYGMVITAFMAGYDPNAQTIFDGMYNFFHKFPTSSHQNLMAWTVDVAGGCKIPTGQSDSATDGDLDIAFALLLAEKQWPGNGYLAKAQAVIADIKNGDIHATTYEPLLGDWATTGDPQYNATRPSDFMIDHFRSYATATMDSSWGMSVDGVYGLISTMQMNYSPSTGLLPDFVVATTTTPAPAQPNFLEGARDGQYGWNSCRTPWRIGTDYLASGDSRSKTAIQPMNTWIMSATGNDPSMIMDGYTLSGGKGSGQSGPSQAFSSPFGVAAMLGTDQAWLDSIWSSRQINEGYFADSITMICMIVMSGNWWAP